MATYQHKRGAGVPPDALLKIGELGIDLDDNALYVGTSGAAELVTSVDTIARDLANSAIAVNDTQDIAIALNTAKIGVTTEVKSDLEGTGSFVIENLITLNQLQYDALVIKVPTTLYAVTA